MAACADCPFALVAYGRHVLQFNDLGLAEPLLRSLTYKGYITPTPIQAQAIPPILLGKDVLGCAQTGTGKTAAFALPVLHRLTTSPLPERRVIRALILVPTRELANQVVDSFRTYGHHTDLRYTVVFGGVGQNTQVRALRQGVDVLVAAPGRLLDLMDQGFIDLRHVETFILDEADRMLDMGFIKPIQQVVQKLPAKRQNLMFSATMAPAIRSLADKILRQPVAVSVAPAATTADKVSQSVYFVERDEKLDLLLRVLAQPSAERVIVFSRTKHGADRLVRHVLRHGGTALAIHGNKAQRQRERALEAFREGRAKVLIATDVAARGIDVDGITHVVNYDIPNEPDSYVHRIGRTARAGATGQAVSFCDRSERAFLRDIEKLTKQTIAVAQEKPFAGQATPMLGPVPKFQPHAPARPSNARRPDGNRPQPKGNKPQPGKGAPARTDPGAKRPGRFAKPAGQRN